MNRSDGVIVRIRSRLGIVVTPMSTVAVACIVHVGDLEYPSSVGFEGVVSI